MAWRLVRLYTGDDGQSHVSEGQIELDPLDRNAASPFEPVARIRFEETAPGPVSPGTPPPSGST